MMLYDTLHHRLLHNLLCQASSLWHIHVSASKGFGFLSCYQLETLQVILIVHFKVSIMSKAFW